MSAPSKGGGPGPVRLGAVASTRRPASHQPPTMFLSSASTGGKGTHTDQPSVAAAARSRYRTVVPDAPQRPVSRASLHSSVSSPTGSDHARSAPLRDCALCPPPETPLRFPSASDGPMEGLSPGGDVDLLGNIPGMLDSIVSILEQREADESDPELRSTVVRSAIALFNVFLDSHWATARSGPTKFNTSLPDYISHRAPPVPPPYRDGQ